MEAFGTLYDKMSTNYSTIENMMGEIYSQIQNNPSNSQLQGILQGLGDVAKGMLQSQIGFTESYCKDDVKNMLVENLYNRYESLEEALNNTKGKTL